MDGLEFDTVVKAQRYYNRASTLSSNSKNLPSQYPEYIHPEGETQLRRASVVTNLTSTNTRSPAYLPPQWSKHIHPEGEIYFARASVPAVVTTADLYNPEVAINVTRWINHILELSTEKTFVVHKNVELFIKIDADQDCFYYCVDKTSHVVFWVEDCDTSQLNLGVVTSTSHLKTLLEAEYWDHVQTFPMHTSGLPLENIDELISILTHAAADHLTSSSGTPGFDAEKCMKFVKILKATRDNHRNGYTTCVAARLWNVIQHTRQWNYYEQKQARLATIQPILDFYAVDVPCWSGLPTSAASSKTVEAYLSSFVQVSCESGRDSLDTLIGILKETADYTSTSNSDIFGFNVKKCNRLAEHLIGLRDRRTCLLQSIVNLGIIELPTTQQSEPRIAPVVTDNGFNKQFKLARNSKYYFQVFLVCVESEITISNLNPFYFSQMFSDNTWSNVVDKVLANEAKCQLCIQDASITDKIPSQWSIHVHPEGDLYFKRNSTPMVITTAYLYNTIVAETATHWINHITKQFPERKIPTSKDIELFIQLDNDLNYRYDKRPQHLQNLDAASHLNRVFKAEYWDHVQKFPMHVPAGFLPVGILGELVNTLTKTLDDKSSPPAENVCDGLDGDTICTVARLWHKIHMYQCAVATQALRGLEGNRGKV
ncbi:hypothetical protein BDQ12DRAFT_763242 [Crucibulum laeve]|uniref:Uncharacterized protein n=1 Tax=Crucibulum laeve TaxID=68775 RepID=A0A5C3LR66_9AGAR|nr:hypothetical protein BDQ12DRAFT_763242 [Crucibulum laeve]